MQDQDACSDNYGSHFAVWPEPKALPETSKESRNCAVMGHYIAQKASPTCIKRVASSSCAAGVCRMSCRELNKQVLPLIARRRHGRTSIVRNTTYKHCVADRRFLSDIRASVNGSSISKSSFIPRTYPTEIPRRRIIPARGRSITSKVKPSQAKVSICAAKPTKKRLVGPRSIFTLSRWEPIRR
jgi:hypothetical protein